MRNEIGNHPECSASYGQAVMYYPPLSGEALLQKKPVKPKPFKPIVINFHHAENGTVVSHFNGEKHVDMVFTEKRDLISYLRKVL